MTWKHPRRIVWLLAAATLIPIAVLSVLGVRVLQQDQTSEAQRRREAIEVAGLRLSVDIERRLQDVEAQLAKGDGVVLLPSGPASGKASPMLYQPSVPLAASALPSSVFQDAETLEHQRNDLMAAAATYRTIASSPSQRVRAAALLGLGRVLRKSGDRTGSLQAYVELEALGLTPVAEQPAALVAKQARARAFEEAGDLSQLRQEAMALGRMLRAGGWPIDRPTFDVYSELVTRWGGDVPAADAIARTEAAIRLWRSWRTDELPANGRRIVYEGTTPVLAIWAGGPDRPVVGLMTSNELASDVGALSTSHGIRAVGRDLEGRLVFGVAHAGGASLMPSDTRLPFILDVAPIETRGTDGSLRRAVLVGGLSIAFLLMLGAAFGLYRATTRELVLAKQQADFVSAVSHEFRTPLTSMRHLTDLLATRGIQSEERRAHYYQLLSHETERLYRMVEGLLSFGRIEAGAYAWRLDTLDVATWLGSVVDDFRQDSAAKAREIVVEIDNNLPPILADAEALSRALWNLLENAAKYSQGDAPIRVFATRSGKSVRVGVGDRGFGIPPEERGRIFQKFARGDAAARAGIRGVGIGLALVKGIVEAHGGSVEVESESGRGSTFTLVIPCPES